MPFISSLKHFFRTLLPFKYSHREVQYVKAHDRHNQDEKLRPHNKSPSKLNWIPSMKYDLPSPNGDAKPRRSTWQPGDSGNPSERSTSHQVGTPKSNRSADHRKSRDHSSKQTEDRRKSGDHSSSHSEDRRKSGDHSSRHSEDNVPHSPTRQGEDEAFSVTKRVVSYSGVKYDLPLPGVATSLYATGGAPTPGSSVEEKKRVQRPRSKSSCPQAGRSLKSGQDEDEAFSVTRRVGSYSGVKYDLPLPGAASSLYAPCGAPAPGPSVEEKKRVQRPRSRSMSITGEDVDSDPILALKYNSHIVSHHHHKPKEVPHESTFDAHLAMVEAKAKGAQTIQRQRTKSHEDESLVVEGRAPSYGINGIFGGNFKKNRSYSQHDIDDELAALQGRMGSYGMNVQTRTPSYGQVGNKGSRSYSHHDIYDDLAALEGRSGSYGMNVQTRTPSYGLTRQGSKYHQSSAIPDNFKRQVGGGCCPRCHGGGLHSNNPCAC